MKIEISIDEYAGRKVKEAREALGMKQENLAQKIGLSSMGLSHLERGKRGWRLIMLERVAEELKKPVTYFFTPSPTE